MPPATLDDSLVRLLNRVRSNDPLAGAGREQRIRLLLLDTLGCAIAGLATPEARSLAGLLGEAEPGCLAFPGLGAALASGAFLMAFSAAACAFEGPEGLASAHGRPGLHAVPAVLAHALPARRTLREVLTAIACGYEVGGRVGQQYRILPGMHVDGTWGTFAAVAGIGRLLDLPVATIMTAIDVAACQLPLSLYHPIAEGSALRNLYVGHGAVLASHAVTAARAGMGRAPDSLERHMTLLLGEPPAALLEPAADDGWLVDEGYLKKYPTVKHVHYAIEAALRWREGLAIAPGDRVVYRTYAEALTYCGNRDPRSAIAAQFSLAWGLAWSLVKGDFTVAAFMPEGLADEAVRALEARVEIEVDPVLTKNGRRGGTLSIARPGGEANPVTVMSVPGDPDRPLGRADVTEKFVTGASPVIGRERALAQVGAILDGSLDDPLRLD